MEADERNVRLANENEELRDKYSKVVDKQQLTECKFSINICLDLVPSNPVKVSGYTFMFFHGGESLDILHLYSDRRDKNICHYFFNTE